MTTPVTNTTFSSTYKDDFRDSDNYHRILFNSGRALQARELTQMQTIIQSEIARFARNIFTDGAVVESGGVTVNNRIEFIKLDTSLNPLPADPQTLVGKEFTVKAPDPGIKFRVLRVEVASGADPATLYVAYNDTRAGTSSAVPIRVPNGSTFEASGAPDLKAVNAAATGSGTLASISTGSFFTQNHFVFAEEQTIFVDKYSSFPTVDLGFKTVEEVITAEDDEDLYDNQGAAPNLTAPGADRYRIRLVMTTRDQIDSDENFVFVAKITNGLVSRVIGPADNYNQITEVLAKRTSEESGNYVVKNFIAKFDEFNDSNLSLDVSSGIAYVDGYRLEIAPSKIIVPKARDTEEVENEVVIVQYGNYVLGNPADNVDLPDISTHELVNLRSDSAYGGSTLGTARVRAIEEDGSNLRFYLSEINMNSGQSFRDVKSFGSSGSSVVNTVLTGGIASLTATGNNTLLYSLPRNRPTETGVSDIVMTVQKKFVVAPDDTSATISAGGGDVFVNTSDWIITNSTGAVGDLSCTFTLTGTPVGSQVLIDGLTAGQTYHLYAYIIVDSPTIRAKSLTENATDTFAWPGDAESDGAGTRFINLAVPDVYKIKRLRQTDSDGPDLTSNFIFDDGQRDNYYGLARLIEKTGRSIPTGDVYVKYDYFTHGAGDLFAVNSYNGAVSYENIPSYNLGGRTISLRDVLDFRPIKSSDGTYSAGNINLLPQNQDAVVSDVEYYLPRRDQLIVKSISSSGAGVGELIINQGISSINPQVPEDQANSMAIYNILMNPYTVDDSDVELSPIKNKRFTMKDISVLESRLNQLAEVTSLSLLELDTSTLSVLDSNGLDRTKSGFFADNFEDFTFSDIDAADYRASREPTTKIITPAVNYGNVRLFFDSDNVAQDVGYNGDFLTLPYTETEFEYQNLANETLNVNPFEVIINTGALQLSPASDDWVEQEYLPDVLVSGGIKKRNVGTQYKTVRTLGGWFGIALAIASFATGFGALVSAGLKLGGATVGAAIGGGLATTIGYYAGAGLAVASAAQSAASVVSELNNVSIASNQVVVRDDIIVEQIGNKVLQVNSIPFMRSVKVYFKAEGLKPNQQHFAFFNGVDVQQWVREEPFKRFSSTTESYGDQYKNASEHPQGKSDLISNDEGVIEGSFFIPSTPNIKFRTGSKIFKLLNITVDNDNDATSLCQAIFTSTGVIETRQRTQKVTREIDTQTVVVRKKSVLCFWDPLAQSFLVSQTDSPSGIFITSVDIFFKTKPALGGQPVQVQIRGMENGYPQSWALQGAVKYLSPQDVNIPADVNDLESVRAAPTRFTFDEPIFLEPGQEYAIVVAAETTDYEVYAAKTYEYLLGSTEARVTKQATLGSLFKSQNGTTWTADQNRDLMFRLNRAEFSSSGTAYLRNIDPPAKLMQPDPFLATNGSNVIRAFQEGHGFVKNDTVTIYGLDSSSTYGGVKGTSILGERTVVSADWSGFTFNADSNATSTLRMGGDNVIFDQQYMYNVFYPDLQVLTPNNTGITSSIRLTSGASWAGDRNENTNSAYSLNSYIPININNILPTTAPKLIPNAKNKASNMSGNDPVLLKLDLTTLDPRVSPIIDLQRSSFTTIENSIDKQDSASSSGFNVPLQFVPETDPYDGSSASKHITTPSTIVEPAVGLKINFSAYRPFEANFKVYYRTSTDEGSIFDQAWVYIDEPNTIADDFNLREYSYLIGGDGGTLPAFTSYQIKIVMETTNTSKIPFIKDLRVIALAV